MDELIYVYLVRIDNGELWFYKEKNGNLVQHRKLTTIIDGEIIEEGLTKVVS